MNWLEDSTLPVELWQVEDYRCILTEELFTRLSHLGIPLDKERFSSYAEEENSPEELTDTLWADEDLENFDRAYLIVFELWRRLLPNKQSPSIFCDELDRLITQYDQESLEDEDQLYEALIELEKILDQNTDHGVDPHLVFKEISLYCAHDLESFIYDFAAEEIDRQQNLNASELIEGFSPYITDEDWFEFLQLRLLEGVDPQEAEAMLARIIHKQKDHPDFELMLEIARFLINRGAIAYFIQTLKQARPHIQTEQDFQEILAIACQFYRLLDKDNKALITGDLLAKRQLLPLEKEIHADDPDVKELYDLVEDLDWSEA
jgi:hypothetical protein